MKFGTKMHLHHEQWLLKGELPDYSPEGLAARKGIAGGFYPAPGEGLGVEHKIERVLDDGTIYTGAIDLVDLRPISQLVPYEDAYGNKAPIGIRLYDHKSCASMRYAKSEAELREDVSASFYASEVMRLTGETAVNCRWVYAERVGSKVEPRNFRINAPMAAARWEKTHENVRKMKVLNDDLPRWQDVTPNYDACSSYGGCHLRASCSLAKSQETAMGLLDHLNGLQAPQQQTGILAKLQTGTPIGAAVAGPPAPLQALLAAPQPPSVEDLMAEGSEGLEFGVNPSDAAPPDLQLDTVEKKSRKKREKRMDPVSAGEVETAKRAEAAGAEQYSKTVCDEVGSHVEYSGNTAQTLRAAPKTLLERVAALEAGGSLDLEPRIAALEARIEAIAAAVGL